MTTQKKKGFFEKLGLGFGTVVARSWKFGPSKKHTVTLEHDCMTGRRKAWVNKKLIHDETVFPDRSFEIDIPDIGGKAGRIVVRNKIVSLQIHYHFYWGGVEQISRMFDNTCAQSLENVIKVSVPEFIIEGDVAMFIVEVKSARSSTSARFQRRFSEFIELYQHVHASFAGSHLARSVPKPPPRRFRFWSDHTSATFLEKRRAALDQFLKNLIVLPRMASDQYLNSFLKPFFTASTKDTLAEAAAAAEVVVTDNGPAAAEKAAPLTSAKKKTTKSKKKKKKKPVVFEDSDEQVAELAEDDDNRGVIDMDDI